MNTEGNLVIEMVSGHEPCLRYNYDRELAESFLFPESSHSERGFLYIGSRYADPLPSDVDSSLLNPKEHNLMKNVACVARFLKKAQEKGLCLERILDDDTADTILSFLSEATIASIIDDGDERKSSGTFIKPSCPPRSFTTASRKAIPFDHESKSKSTKIEMLTADAVHFQADVMDASPKGVSTASRSLDDIHLYRSRVSTSYSMPKLPRDEYKDVKHKELQTGSGAPTKSSSAKRASKGSHLKSETRGRSQTTTTKRADKMKRPRSETRVCLQSSSSKRVGKGSRSKSETRLLSKSSSIRIRRRHSDIDFQQDAHPQFLELLDSPAQKSVCLPPDHQTKELIVKRINLSAYHQQMKNMLHSTIKERKWLNLQVCLAKQGCRAIDLISLLSESTLQPIDFQTLDPNSGVQCTALPNSFEIETLESEFGFWC